MKGKALYRGSIKAKITWHKISGKDPRRQNNPKTHFRRWIAHELYSAQILVSHLNKMLSHQKQC